MIKSSKHIEIVRSTVRGLSSMSQESCNGIFTVLTKHYTKVGVTIVNSSADLEVLADSRPDLVFLGMEFVPQDASLGPIDPHKIWLSDYLDSHGIAYTGSGRAAYELGRNKSLAKQCVLDVGLATTDFCVIKQGQLPHRDDIALRFPLFVKPTSRGGGLGIDSDSVVHNFEQLLAKVHTLAAQLHSDSLVEEYLPGREFSVAILKDGDPKGFLVMPIELIAPLDRAGTRLLSGRVKASNTEQVLKVTDRVLGARVKALALDAFHALGARDYGRIDIRLDSYGVPHFLEANLIPSLISGYGSFPKACVLNMGLGYERMILKIAQLGLARNLDDTEDTLDSSTMSNPFLSSSDVALKPV